MKHIAFISLLLSVLIVSITSCGSSKNGAYGGDTDIDPYTRINSVNEYDLIVADKGVQYTIDISTPEGKMKLNKLTLDEAKQLVNAEAAMAYNCAVLVRPKYTFLKDGKKILRITVFGFPANYKNSRDNRYVPEQNRTRQEIIIRHQ